MAYGTIKVDTITFTDDGSDVSVSVSGLAKNPTFSGDLTVTGTISGTVIQGGTTISGVTVTGTTANFVSGVYTTQISGATITGDAGQFTTLTGGTAGFTTVTGTTVTGTTANFVSGVFTTQVSGATITGDAGEFTTLTGGTAGFTTVTGTTVTGTTANFVTVSGTTVTGNAGNFTTATVTSGVFASGTAGAPSVSVGTTDNGLYSPGTDQVALASSGVQRANFGTSEVVFNDGGADYDFRIEGDTEANLLFVDASTDRVGVGTSNPTHKLHVAAGFASLKLDPPLSGVANELVMGNGAGLFWVHDDRSSDGLQLSTAANFSGAYPITLKTESTNTALFIDTSSRVGIGTTSPSYQLELSTDSAGKPSTNTWTIVSDERIKEDIEFADLDICYDAIKNIPLKRFKWKDEVYTEEQVPDRHKLGWIAQDVETVFPKAVQTHEFKYKQVFEETVIPAVKEELDEDNNVITSAQPERIEKGELISEEVIEDCRNLNADQLYAAMYGAIQKLISKVETLEAELQELKTS